MRVKLYICIFCICLGVLGCGQRETSELINGTDVVPPVTIEAIPQPTPSPTPVPTPEPPKEIQLMMVGDNLMHMGIVRTGEQADGSYNYDILFEGIQPFLEQAEIKMINQETILGGNEKGFSGYPYFNSPTEVGDAIVDAGFNVVLHASNHAADKGIDGLKSCLEYWQQYPKMLVSGIHDKGVSPIQILTIEGVDFAILNYTYGPNMEVIPDSIEPHLDMLCNYNEANQLDFTTLNPQVLKDIEEAEQMADIVIVCPHWGTEYTTKPSSYQKKFAKQMVEAGADIIIGTHPHVVQPMEWVESENGNRALCYYSLGNYVSSQKQALCMLEAMAWITFELTENGAVLKEEETGVVPMVCQYSAMPVRFEKVYLLEDYTEELAAVHGIKAYGGVDLVLSELQTWTQDVFGDNVLSVEQILGDTLKDTDKPENNGETAEHSELYIPGVSVEDVILYFNEVCLDAEFVNSGDPTKLQRWVKPIRYTCSGSVTDVDFEVMLNFMDWLNTIDGFPGICEATESEAANLRIYFCDYTEYLEKMGDNLQGTDGGVTFWYDGANQIYDAIIGYRTDIDQEIRNSVILEEIYNGLGPINDTGYREDSIIYSGYSTPQSLTEVDELLLRLLYHPQMQCGMDAAACEAVIRRLYY